MTLPAARLTDKDTLHDCGIPLRAKGSINVFVNGLPWSRLVDINTVHIINGKDPCSKPHVGFISKGSKRTFINGLPAGRIVDKVTTCGVVAQGSIKVFAG